MQSTGRKKKKKTGNRYEGKENSEEVGERKTDILQGSLQRGRIMMTNTAGSAYVMPSVCQAREDTR